jgi:hypothetical protein
VLPLLLGGTPFQILDAVIVLDGIDVVDGPTGMRTGTKEGQRDEPVNVPSQPTYVADADLEITAPSGRWPEYPTSHSADSASG